MVLTSTKRLSDAAAGRLPAAPAHYDPHKIGSVARLKLVHEVGAVNFNGARGNSERLSRFFVGRAADQLNQNIPFA